MNKNFEIEKLPFKSYLNFQGESMAPFLKNEDRLTVEFFTEPQRAPNPNGKIQVGDIALIRQNNEWVTHRVLSIDPTKKIPFRLKGDHSLNVEESEAIWGRVTGYNRAGHGLTWGQHPPPLSYAITRLSAQYSHARLRPLRWLARGAIVLLLNLSHLLLLTRKVTRRFRQFRHLLFSEDFESPEAALKLIGRRYSEATEVNFYRAATQVGLEEFELEALKKAVGPHPRGRAAVIGCGAGREVFALRKFGFQEVVGYDLSPPMIEAAKSQATPYGTSVKFVCGKFDVSANDKKFDFIWVAASVENLLPGNVRCEFWNNISGALTTTGLVMTSPIIRPLRRLSAESFASRLLWFRWPRQWSRGDHAVSFLGPHNDTEKPVFFHAFPSSLHYKNELSQAGLAGHSFKEDNSLWLIRKARH